MGNLPINHVGCLMNLTLGAVVGGGSILFPQRLAAAQTFRLLREEGVTPWLQAPTLFHACVNPAEFDASSLAHLKRPRIGGGADDGVPGHRIGRFEMRCRFRVADDTGQPCAVGVTGEIQGRGARILADHFGASEATGAAFTADGWLKTGDLACPREDDKVDLKGRPRETIKSGGCDVDPREIDVVRVCSPTRVGALHGSAPGEAPDVAKIAAHVLHRLLDPTPIPRKGTPHRE